MKEVQKSNQIGTSQSASAAVRLKMEDFLSTTPSVNETGELRNETEEEEVEQSLYRSYEISRMIDRISLPIIVLFGTVGNLLIFYVLTKGSLRKVSTCFYMRLLSVADSCEYNFPAIQDSRYVCKFK